MRPDDARRILQSQARYVDAEEQIMRRACRSSLSVFSRQFWPVLEPGRKLVTGWALDAIMAHLEAVTRGEIRHLLMNVPPGAMKSLSTRVFWPAWTWTNDPTKQFIGASYAADLAMRDNRKARQIITSETYRRLFPAVRLSSDQAEKSNFTNTASGFMLATSVHGRATGERGDIFVIDDPHNVLEAESAVVRKETLRWFEEAVPSRVNDLDKSAFVIIMQRVHHDDLAAAAIAQGYEHLCIPMEFEPERKCYTSIGWEDPRTEDGELMWPERFSRESVDQLKAGSTYVWSSQYQQSPTPREGALFLPDEINKVPTLPPGTWTTVRGWDLAASVDLGASYTAGVLVGYNHDTRRFCLIDVRRRRLGPDAVKRLMRTVAEADGLDVPIVFPQDPGQAGKAQVRDLGATLSGFTFQREIQSGDKATRATPLASQVEAGNVDMIEANWNRDLLEEMRQFPLGLHADQVDAASSAYNRLSAIVAAGVGDLVVRRSKVPNPARIR